jgi:hypothetical protein
LSERHSYYSPHFGSESHTRFPLHLAISSLGERSELVLVLLKHGCNPNSKSSESATISRHYEHGKTTAGTYTALSWALHLWASKPEEKKEEKEGTETEESEEEDKEAREANKKITMEAREKVVRLLWLYGGVLDENLRSSLDLGHPLCNILSQPRFHYSLFKFLPEKVQIGMKTFLLVLNRLGVRFPGDIMILIFSEVVACDPPPLPEVRSSGTDSDSD